MSQYISSFLIEPVVRQARRFSRPDHDPYAECACEADHHPRYPDTLNPTTTTATTRGKEEAQMSALTSSLRDGESMGLNVAIDDDLSPMPVSGSQNTRPEMFRGNEIGSSRPQPIAIINDEPEPFGTHRRSRGDSDTSINPFYWSNRLRSSVSSFGSSPSAQGQTASGAEMDANEASQGDRTGQILVDIQVARHEDGSLPADDGMGCMRRRILAIHQTNYSSAEKARLIHELMTEKHNASHGLQALNIVRPHSPCSMQSSEPPLTPSSIDSMDSLRRTISPATSSGSSAELFDPFHLSPEDLKPTYFTPSSPLAKDTEVETRASDPDDEPRALGCAHYKRNIKLQCSACDRWYTCRFCHDEVEDHNLNRKETKNMLCMLCGCAQPAGDICCNCGERGAWYYCDECKLWEDDPHKSIYHCNDCGICRVGQGLGKDFFHCKTCCVCMSISIRDTHRCIERSTDCDCPICGEYMFTSPQTVVFMRCGHSIHHRCYNEHMKSSYRCPICSRSIVNMEWQFTRLQRAIEAQPMPREFQNTRALVHCNDCNAKSSTPFHWLGLKCALCDSYNTAQLQIMNGPDPGSSLSNPRAPVAPPSPPASVDHDTSFDPDSEQTDPSSPTRSRLVIQGLPPIRNSTSAPPSPIDMPVSLPPQPYSSLDNDNGTNNTESGAVHSHQCDHSALTAHHLPPLSLGASLIATHPTCDFAQPTTSRPSPLDAEDSVDDDDSDDDDDDDDSNQDDVEFWGGESPTLREWAGALDPRRRVPRERGSEEDEEIDDDDDGEDESAKEEDEEEDEDEDPMEIFGHR